MSNQHKACLLYVAHTINESVIAGWDHLRATCPSAGFDPVFVYDDSRADFRTGETIDKSYLFKYIDLKKRFTLHTYDPHRPLDQGNAIFPILSFFRDHPQYRFYWRIEYDVLLDGDWSAFLGNFSDNEAHLLGTTLTDRETRPDWVWWDSFQSPWYVWRDVRLIRSFLPVARLSNKACAALDRAYSRGWRGHDEVSVPTILNHRGLRIEDFGGSGHFVSAANLERFYTNDPLRRGLAPGTFVCPPEEPTLADRHGMLYHPVKDRSRWLGRVGPSRSVSA